MKKHYFIRIAMILLGAAIISPVLAQSPITGPSFTATQYKKALWITHRMYGGQRSGDKNTSNGNWLLFGHSAAPDGRTFLTDADNGYDLSGGWFDCGDHVKFGHTQYWSAYVLLKGFAEFAAGYDDRYAADYAGYKNANNYTFEGSGHAPNNIPDILDEAKHATDYIIKCTPDANNFYYQVGDGGPDHMQWVTAAKMQSNPTSTGGEPRAIFKNPADGAMPALAGAALALMSRLYRPYNATYADLCLTHAKYAYSYAKPRKTQTVGAPGGFYGTNSNPQNAYAILVTELYWATNDASYKTEALGMTVDASATTANVQGNTWGMDYANNGDLAVYNLYLLGKTGADVAFNTIVNSHYLGNVQSDGQFNGGNVTYGPLRYNAGGAFIVALWTKRNSITTATKTFIYSNIDYILGKNSNNYSFVVGFSSNGATHPHHRNVYMSDANNNSNLTIPTKNQQHGYMVGGSRNPGSYQDVTNNYQYTEGGIDYSSALVGALAWINIQVAPVNKFSVADVVAVAPTVTLTAPANNSNVCAGSPVTLTATATISSGTVSRVDFYDGSTLLGSSTTSPYSYTWNNPSTGAHTVQAIAVSGDGTSSAPATASITVNAIPAAPTVTSPVNYCLNATASALSATGSGLKWYTDATGGTGSTTAPTPSTATAGTTNYYVSQTSGSCESSRSQIAVVVNSLPDATITAGGSTTVCQGTTVTLTASTGASYKWYNGTSQVGTSQSYAATVSGSYTVEVTNTAGCKKTSAATTVTVNPIPAAPTVASPVNYCLNATASALSASGTGLNWYTNATGGTGSTTAPTPSTATAGTTNYYVSQASGSCESSRSQIAVVVNSLPDATITAGGSTTVCQGATVTLTASTGTSYIWYNGTSQVGTSQSYAATASGSYTVEVTNAAGCKKTSAATTVTVNPIPAAPTVTSPVNYCLNATASALSASGTGLNWYTNATGGTGSTTAPTPSTATAGTTNYYVSQTSGSCESSRSQIAVVVNSLPDATITAGGSTTVCQGTTVNLTASTGTSYKWYNGTSQVGTSQSYTATSSGSYTVEVTNAAGCKKTSAAITVTVNPLPAAPVVTSPVNYCQNATASALSAGGTDLKWYSASIGGTASATTPTPSTSTTGTVSYYVSQTVNGCESSRETISVIVNELPSATITAGGPTTFVDGGSVTLNANTGTGLSYHWYNGTSTVGTGASSYTATASGSYTVAVTNSFGCTSTSPATTVTVTSNQPSVITITSPTSNSTETGPVTISVTASDPDGSITKVEYLDGNTVIGTSTSEPYSFTWNDPSAGTHVITVRVTDSNGGVTTSSPVTFTSQVATAINPGVIEISSKIYPVPANDELIVETEMDMTGAAFSVITSLGEEILLTGQVGRNNAKLDVSGLQGGVYLLLIRKNESLVKKAITVVK